MDALEALGCTAAELPGLLARMTPAERAEFDALITPPTFRAFVDRVHPKFVWYPHCQIVASVLDRVVAGDLSRVMVFMPPRHGKSEMVSRLLPAYYTWRFPERWVGLASYGASLALRMSRAARRFYQLAGGKLNPEAAAAHEWETLSGGGMWVAGIGGAALGRGYNLGVIDDPTKDAKAASSVKIRENEREWMDGVWNTRLEPQAAQILMMQRWNKVDMPGWLLEQVAEGIEEPWHIVCLEAIKEEEPLEVPKGCTLEPMDWRKPGEPLCPERYPLKKLEAKRRKNIYYFTAQFQQRPRPKAGLLFKWEWLPVVSFKPTRAHRIRYWDLAGTDELTAEDPDFTAGCLMSLSPQGDYIIEDMVWGRWSPGRRLERIIETAQKDAEFYGVHGVEIWLERDTGIGGKERTDAIVSALARYNVHVEQHDTNKVARAEPMAAQAEYGNVGLMKGPWNNDVKHELCDFPKGEHDDKVDACTGAFNKLATAAERVWSESHYAA